LFKWTLSDSNRGKGNAQANYEFAALTAELRVQLSEIKDGKQQQKNGEKNLRHRGVQVEIVLVGVSIVGNCHRARHFVQSLLEIVPTVPPTFLPNFTLGDGGIEGLDRDGFVPPDMTTKIIIRRKIDEKRRL
jgi:hypothetical protein